MSILCFLMLSTVLYTFTLFLDFISSSKISNPIYAPVRPAPALI
uniref:Uncharacterized protein n=1 Tax=Ciona intestinalis TaxID=7719 RepID=H2Y2Z3_CIOIN